ncbi:hypothetical protein [Lishizhenia sp.]|uniref:hypothetical protein n=1 Tax=Lishizhenia sp. TaxID=2497594 RepID=UPI00299F0893|nr:hypothetical protein [Lishizhenia sp.]MDX1444710.1 hypothetical protein [Lishizhenia sp.]
MSTTNYIIPPIEGFDSHKLQMDKEMLSVIEHADTHAVWITVGSIVICSAVLTFIFFETLLFLRNCECFKKIKVQDMHVADMTKQKGVLRLLAIGMLCVFIVLTSLVYLYFFT